MTTTPDPVTDVWELLHTAACDYRDQAGSQRSEARLIDALMPIVEAYGDARVAACPAEPTGELRELRAAMIAALPGVHPWGDAVDRLLSGPLAPLLAKLRAVEALAAELERKVAPRSFHPAGTHSDGASQAYGDAADRIRAALTPQADRSTTHRHDPGAQRCPCGALDHPGWGVTA